MRLATLRTPDGLRAARLEGDVAVLLDSAQVDTLLQDPDWYARAARVHGPPLSLEDATWAPLVVRPEKIICLGLNFASHIAEMGHERPAYPTLFAKFANSLVGHREDILLPAVSHAVDWEVELGVVIGRPARHVSEDDAMNHVAGYTVVNDVSVRDYQTRTSQFLQGKTFDRTTPVGPVLVTPDELPDGDLVLRCEVDGEVVQEGRTSDLIFDVAETVAYLSRIMTLRPGDLIAMGTPGGVGVGRQPPVFLRDGQVVRTVVEGVGELVNRCTQEHLPG